MCTQNYSYDEKVAYFLFWLSSQRTACDGRGKDTIQLFRWFAFCSHFGNKRPLLLRFINRRYHVKLREKDFKTNQDMIQYILDKENTLPLNSPSPTQKFVQSSVSLRKKTVMGCPSPFYWQITCNSHRQFPRKVQG